MESLQFETSEFRTAELQEPLLKYLFASQTTMFFHNAKTDEFAQ